MCDFATLRLQIEVGLNPSDYPAELWAKFTADKLRVASKHGRMLADNPSLLRGKLKGHTAEVSAAVEALCEQAGSGQ